MFLLFLHLELIFHLILMGLFNDFLRKILFRKNAIRYYVTLTIFHIKGVEFQILTIVTTKRLSSVRPLTFHILINSSEATGPI